MSIKKCFRGIKNKELKNLFNNNLQSGMSEEYAAAEAIKIYGGELSKKLTKFTGKVSPVIAGSFKKITEKKEVVTIEKEQKVRQKEVEFQVQTLKGLKNQAFNLFYKSLTSPVLYEDLMTSIDNDTMKDSMTSLLTPKDKSKFGVFSPLEAIDILFQYKAGAAGIGEWANSSNDHIRAQNLGISIAAELGTWGNTYMDEQFSESLDPKDLIELVEDINKIKRLAELPEVTPEQLNEISISNSLSELINAFVDIANEDAYVTRANWGSILNGYGGLLLRAGVHPYKVSAMFLQPAMTEFIQTASYSEGIIENTPAYEILDDLMKEYEVKLKDAWKSEYEAPLPKELMKSIKEQELSELFAPGGFRDFRDMANGKRVPESYNDFKTQYLVLHHYKNSLNLVKRYNATVTSSKWGENGAGKTAAELLLAENKLSYSFTETDEGQRIVGLDKKYFNAAGSPRVLMKFYNNTAKLALNIFNQNARLFFGANETVFKAVNSFSDRNRVEPYLSNLNAAEELLEAVRAMSLSGFEKFNREYSPKQRQKLVKQIIANKTDNHFLDSLFYEEKEGQTHFYMNRVAAKDGYIKDKLSNSWQQLLDDPKTKEAGEFLIAESYRLSGFRPGPNKFYELIPYRWLIENNLHNYVEKLDYDAVMAAFPQQFVGNYAAEGFVKRVRKGIYRKIQDEDGKLAYMEVEMNDNNKIGMKKKFPIMPQFIHYGYRKTKGDSEFTGLESTGTIAYIPMQLVGFKKINAIIKDKLKPTYKAVYKAIPKLVPAESEVMSIKYDIDKGTLPLGEEWKTVAEDDSKTKFKISTLDIPSSYWKELDRKDLLNEQLQRLEVSESISSLTAEEESDIQKGERNKKTNC